MCDLDGILHLCQQMSFARNYYYDYCYDMTIWAESQFYIPRTASFIVIMPGYNDGQLS